jgi:hypothetical protein
VPPDCGAPRTARPILAACQPQDFVFRVGRSPDILPGKDAPAGFSESRGPYRLRLLRNIAANI